MKLLDKTLKKLKPSVDTRQTAMNALITTLKLLETVSDGIPVFGDPLKAAVGGAIQVLEQVEAAKGNAEVFIRLDQDISTLTEGLLKPLKDSGLDPSEYPPGLVEDITKLTNLLRPICQTILDKSKRSVLARFVSASKDEGDVIEFKDKMNSAIQVFNTVGIIRAQMQAARAEAERKNSRYKELIDKLPRARTAGWNADRSNAHVSCFEGTREGVLQTITDWIYGDVTTTPRVFWLNGLAGIGKSTIARTIAERAFNLGILGGSFFFSRNDDELNNVKTLFSTLAHQLAQFDPAYLKAVASALEQDIDLGSKNTATQSKKLFFDPILRSDHKPTVLLLVLDALDEALPKDAVKETLQLLLSVDVPFSLRVFLTSRPEAHIRRVFDNDRYHSRCVLHDIEGSIVEGDIRRFLEHKLPTIPKELGIPLPYWPSASDLDAVVAKAGRLFIFAATVVRFVADDGDPDPQGRLTQILRSQAASGSSTYQQLDQLYLNILRSAVAQVDDPEHIIRLRATLAAIVLFRNPIPLFALAALIGYDPHQVLLSLYHLHSLMLVPSTIQDTPKIYHLSFPDFITDSSRCTDVKFYIDIQSQETSLLLQCLGTMMKSLQFNMGSFDMGPYTITEPEFRWDGRLIFKSMSNKDISHDGLISPELGYACQFWCSHLLMITNPIKILDQLKVFSSKYLLFWVEAMSLLGLVESARVSMRDACQWASNLDCEKDLIDILYDGYRLIWLYQSHISSFTMNVYLAALSWMPQNTLLYKIYKSLAITEVVYPKALIWSSLLSSENVPYRKLYSVAYAPNGQYFATGSKDGYIDLWNALSGAHIRSFEIKFPKWINKICYLLDSQSLVSISNRHKEVYLWDIITGKHVLTFQGHSDNLADISVTLEQLATASDDKTVKIWNIKTTQCQSTLQHSSSVNSVWLDPKGHRLLSATRSGVFIWNPTTREQVRVISKSDLWQLIVSPCGNFIACASKYTIQIFKSQAVDTCIKSVQSTEPWNAVFSSCGNYIAFSQQNTIVISRFQSSDKSEIRLQTNIDQIAFSPDSKQLVSVYQQTCLLWDLDSRFNQSTQYHPSNKLAQVQYITVSNNQILCAISDRSNYITIWNFWTKTTTTIKAMLSSPNVWITLAFSIDNLLLATGSTNSKVLILNLQTQEENTTICYYKEEVIEIAFQIEDECTALVFSSDNLQLAAGNNKGKVWIFDVQTRNQVFCLNAETTTKIQRMIFLNNNQKLIVANSDTKFQYNLELQYMLMSKEKNTDLYPQDWTTKDILISEQNLVFLKIQNNKYLPILQIVDFTDKSDIRYFFKINDLVILSFQYTGYILQYLE